MTTIAFRLATSDDAPAVAAIYAPYVERTPISFESTPPSPAEMLDRMAEAQRSAPWYVATSADAVVGYAYGSRHRARDGYRFSVDVSVYLDERFHRRGIARALYERLLADLTAMGYYNAFAGITLPNAASEKFHATMGFSPVGIYKAVGFKHGKWHDTGWYQRVLRPAVGVPHEVTPVPR
jgi:phosphinothricin acetyltransferase